MQGRFVAFRETTEEEVVPMANHKYVYRRGKGEDRGCRKWEVKAFDKAESGRCQRRSGGL
jgi:hypothetical protein